MATICLRFSDGVAQVFIRVVDSGIDLGPPA